MNLKQLIIVLVAGIFFSQASYSQYLENDPKPSQRIFYGGNFGMSFGSVNYIEVSPLVGYRITDRLSAGIGLSYTYVGSKQYDYNGHCYGGSAFASFSVIKNFANIIPLNINAGLLIYGENILLNVANYYHSSDIKWVNTPLLGGAIQIPVSHRSYLMLMVLYNFNETIYSQYSNPVIKISFNF
ncbi:MAG: hypothetical protein LBQ22_01060 [Bacteroidales bacterium]|jgi:hypothetical protein|nr:hypothetical protein [Bacteroidales bacterium]